MPSLITILLLFCFSAIYGQRYQINSFIDDSNRRLIDSLQVNTNILLEEVHIMGQRSYLADSLRFRKQYASVFNERKTSWKDLIVSKNYFNNMPIPYNRATNSTASIVNLNILSLVGLLGKNKSSRTKLRNILLQEEQEKYLAHAFSPDKVRKITGLHGDSLSLFIQYYRLNKEEITKMSEYDILSYIKESFERFKTKDNP